MSDQTPNPNPEPAAPAPAPASPPGGRPAGAEKKIPAGICGILLGALGVHKFILGYTMQGIIMLLVTLLGGILVLPAMIMGVIGLIEGILYLVKSDEEFVNTYITNKKGWF